MSSEFGARTTVPARALPFRLIGSIWRQQSRSVRCPDAPRLDGKRAVVTGGNAGIGIEIARGLARRGADVVIAARNAKTAAAAIESIAKETSARVRHVPLDLSDLASVRTAVDALGDDGAIDVLVCNAGLWPQAHALSAQGHEIAFATNTLGHHVLLRRLLDGKKLAPSARVVVVTGDIYIRARECTSDFVYVGRGGGAMAYSRSKLGNLWFAFELQRRYPSLEACVVHPGVIASGLGGGERPAGFFRDNVMLDLAGGAQAPLWCATQPIERGTYYHNTLGRMLLRAPDPAADPKAAEAMWARLETLGAAFL